MGFITKSIINADFGLLLYKDMLLFHAFVRTVLNMNS